MKMVRQRLKTAGDSKTSEKWHKMTTNQGNTKTKYEDNNEEIWKDNNETLTEMSQVTQTKWPKKMQKANRVTSRSQRDEKMRSVIATRK